MGASTLRGVGEGRTKRYTVKATAEMFGISTGAVRNRLSGGTLASVKENGVLYCGKRASTITHIYPSALQGVWASPHPRPAVVRFVGG